MPAEQTPILGNACGPNSVILVVEDEVIIRISTASLFAELGFSPIEARDAAEAVALLRTTTVIDVVFSDVRMPGAMNGFGLLRWMRAHCPNIPMLLTSAHAQTQELVSEGFDPTRFFPKPYDAAAVAVRARAVIDGR